MATHFQILGLNEDDEEVLLWSDVTKGDTLIFSAKSMFEAIKSKNETAKLTKWTQGDKEVTVLMGGQSC